MDQFYVVGHVNPDTDLIASAMGYAWLLRERDGRSDVVPARAGATNPQTTWVLKSLGLEAPELLTEIASPIFGWVTRRLDTVRPESLVREAWAITSRTGGIAPVVQEDAGVPLGLITGSSLFNLIVRLVGPHPRAQGKPLAEILDITCKEACDTRCLGSSQTYGSET